MRGFIAARPVRFGLSVLGIAIGIAALIWFVALGHGLRTHVLDRIFSNDQVELVPGGSGSGFSLSNPLGGGEPRRVTEAQRQSVAALEHVRAVHPRAQFAFPGYAVGGGSLLGRDLWGELIGDGLPAEAVDDLPAPERPDLGFVDWDARVDCQGDADCSPGSTCQGARCVALACTPEDEVWQTPGRAFADQAAALLRARLRNRDVSIRDLGESAGPSRFRVAASGVPAAEAAEWLAIAAVPGSAPAVSACPRPAYCQIDDRTCQMPVPVVVSNTLLELYNGNVQTMLSSASGPASSLPRLEASQLIGLGLDGILGEGFLGRAKAVQSRATETRRVRMRLVGFSGRAIPVGVTVPIGYVERWNRTFSGGDASAGYASLLVVADSPASVHAIADAAERLGGLQVSGSYVQARRASLALSGVTGFLACVAALLLSLVLSNILQSFHMVAAERARDIGVMRTVGASRRQVEALFLLEGAAVGLTGAIVGGALAAGAMALADAAFARWVPPFPFKPDSLFEVPWTVVAPILPLVIVAAAVAAWLPARRASAVDPVRTLSGG